MLDTCRGQDSVFDWPDVQDTMTAIEDDPTSVVDAAAVRAEAHFKGRDLSDTWGCVLLFAADADTGAESRWSATRWW